MATRTAFITGATGCLGVNLVEQLVRDGWRVFSIQRNVRKTRFLDRFDIDNSIGDVCDRTRVEAAMPERCDAVFHLAADMSFWPRRHRAQYAVNVVGTRNVVETAL